MHMSFVVIHAALQFFPFRHLFLFPPTCLALAALHLEALTPPVFPEAIDERELDPRDPAKS